MKLKELKQRQDQVYLEAYLEKASKVRAELEVRELSFSKFSKLSGVNAKTIARFVNADIQTMVSAEYVDAMEEALWKAF